jgi:DNA excision repair protein ERCC-2
LDDSKDFIRLGKIWKNRANVSISRKCLDPAFIAKDIVEDTHSTILMSATLRPLEMYADVLGFDTRRTIFKEYPSPFPENNRMNIIVKGVTTRYSKRTFEMYKKIANHVSKIVESIPGNVLVVFPSYEYLNNTLPLISTNKKRYVQEENMSSTKLSALISSFKKERNAVFFGVIGGSVSEGVDFPGDELLGVVIVGIPLAEPDLETQALIDYYEEKFGKGWSYGYIYPAINKVVQAAGRCIRSETDKGVVVFLDERYIWRNYARALPNMKKIVTEEPEKYIREFFKK